jgi:hypothetical protein
MTKRLGLTLCLWISSHLALAAHFTGTYQDQQGTTIVIQQGTDGQMQGAFVTANGQFQLQGYGDEHGAYGAIATGERVMGFQARLSPDHSLLQLQLYQMGQNGQPDPSTAQDMTFRKVSDQANLQNPGGGQLPPTPASPVVPGGPAGGSPLGFPAPLQGPAAGWQGRYQGNNGQFILIIQGQQGQYSGLIEASGQQYPFQAQGNEQIIQGIFQANGTTFEFMAERRPDGLVQFVSAGVTYILEPDMAPAMPTGPTNPLSNP